MTFIITKAIQPPYKSGAFIILCLQPTTLGLKKNQQMKGFQLLLISFLIALTMVVLSYCSKKGVWDMNAVKENNVLHQFYSIRGFNMYCEVYGNGTPILFIHGNDGSTHAFKKQIAYFVERNYKVILADSRSQGQSLDPSDSLTYEQMADDYAALLDELHVDATNIVGWSDGGIIGLLIAIRHPERVHKLVITGANLRPDVSAIDDSLLSEMTKEYEKMQEMRENPALAAQVNPKSYKLTRLMVEQPHISVAELERITCPTLVIGGDHDLIKPAHTLEIFQHISFSYLWILPGAGHNTVTEHATEFNAKTDAFISTPFKIIKKL